LKVYYLTIINERLDDLSISGQFSFYLMNKYINYDDVSEILTIFEFVIVINFIIARGDYSNITVASTKRRIWAVMISDNILGNSKIYPELQNLGKANDAR
jgi:hypothetical protein